MEKLTREEFEKWAKDEHWLLIEKPLNPNGEQYTYLTPAGNIDAIVFDLSGKLLGVVQIPAPQVQTQTFRLPGTPFLGKG